MMFSNKKKQAEIEKKIKLAESYLNNEFHKLAAEKNIIEDQKTPLRTDIINYLLKSLDKPTNYLEIGVRDPSHNFNKINSEKKYSVDPGYENSENNVDFKMTSDEFFSNLRQGNVLTADTVFDVIFIDGLHLADQVEKDIENSLEFLSETGYIVMHDCNPPTEFHAIEEYSYKLSPAKTYWNGTTWKAFFKARKRNDIYSCCIDTDFGVGVISKSKNLGKSSSTSNDFFEYKVFDANRTDSLNLISFDKLKEIVEQ